MTTRPRCGRWRARLGSTDLSKGARARRERADLHRWRSVGQQPGPWSPLSTPSRLMMSASTKLKFSALAPVTRRLRYVSQMCSVDWSPGGRRSRRRCSSPPKTQLRRQSFCSGPTDVCVSNRRKPMKQLSWTIMTVRSLDSRVAPPSILRLERTEIARFFEGEVMPRERHYSEKSSRALGDNPRHP